MQLVAPCSEIAESCKAVDISASRLANSPSSTSGGIVAIHLLPAKKAALTETSPLAARLAILVVGTTAMGCGIALLVWSRLGLAPMDVLHAGVSDATGWTFGSGIVLCQLILAMSHIP